MLDREVEGPHGVIPVRVYTPAAHVDRRTGLVWVHGGGFIGGDLDMPEADWVGRMLAHEGITVVSVDYQLSPWPENSPWPGPPPRVGNARFPVASDEVRAVLTWVRTAFDGIAAHAWSLGGASAGGNLAAGATMGILAAAHPAPASVVLFYPLLHKKLPPLDDDLAARLAMLPPEMRFDDATVDHLNVNYVGDIAHLDDPRAFAGGHDLRGFPPVLIVNADSDILRASGDAFACELVRAGVETHAIRETGTPHGFLNDPDNPAAASGVHHIAEWLGRPR